jgi:biopolymer transport protein ExbB
VLAIIEAAGWPIWTILIASVIALAIIGERLWSLRSNAVAPKGLLSQVAKELKTGVTPALTEQLTKGPLMGRVFAAALKNVNSPREVMKEAIEEEGRAVAHELERYLNTLGTIATVSPLLGLFGTVIGMVEIFSALTPTNADPAKLAHGISVSLYNTAMGLVVAIPSLIFYRYFRGKVDALILEMEIQAVKLVEMAHGERK